MDSPTTGASGGSTLIAPRSTGSASTGRAPVARTRRVFARGNHADNWSLKSPGPANERPGRNEVSKNPLFRSITPFDSGSRGGSNRIRVPSVPANIAAGALRRLPFPIADSRSHTSVRDTAPNAAINCHIPDSRSPA